MSPGAVVDIRGSGASPDARENLLTPEEVSAWLKVPKSWLYGRIHSKSLPFAMVKVGRYVRFPQSGVQTFLERASRAER